MADAGLITLLEQHIGVETRIRAREGITIYGTLEQVFTDALIFRCPTYVEDPETGEVEEIEGPVLIPLSALIYLHKADFPYQPGVEPGYSQ